MSEKEAKLYEPPVYCKKAGCGQRLTVAAVAGGSKHCSRLCAGYATREEVAAAERRQPGYQPPSRRRPRGGDPDTDTNEPSDADLEGVAT